MELEVRQFGLPFEHPLFLSGQGTFPGEVVGTFFVGALEDCFSRTFLPFKKGIFAMGAPVFGFACPLGSVGLANPAAYLAEHLGCSLAVVTVKITRRSTAVPAADSFQTFVGVGSAPYRPDGFAGSFLMFGKKLFPVKAGNFFFRAWDASQSFNGINMETAVVRWFRVGLGFEILALPRNDIEDY
jgi:hypothetical protein